MSCLLTKLRDQAATQHREAEELIVLLKDARQFAGAMFEYLTTHPPTDPHDDLHAMLRNEADRLRNLTKQQLTVAI